MKKFSLLRFSLRLRSKNLARYWNQKTMRSFKPHFKDLDFYVGKVKIKRKRDLIFKTNLPVF